MKWDRIVASFLIICGMAYASYSVVIYMQKLDVVQDVSPKDIVEKPLSQLENQSYAGGKNEKQWEIVPKENRPKLGELFASLIIPRLGVEIPIWEGVAEEKLAKGVGHYSRSVLPGEPDNSVLSGHRDTVFRRLGELKKGDQLQVKTNNGTFVYKIEKMWITTAEDRSVIVPHSTPILTLTTCYPFGYLGSAPDRYIIQSKLLAKIN